MKPPSFREPSRKDQIPTMSAGTLDRNVTKLVVSRTTQYIIVECPAPPCEHFLQDEIQALKQRLQSADDELASLRSQVKGFKQDAAETSHPLQ